MKHILFLITSVLNYKSNTQSLKRLQFKSVWNKKFLPLSFPTLIPQGYHYNIIWVYSSRSLQNTYKFYTILYVQTQVSSKMMLLYIQFLLYIHHSTWWIKLLSFKMLVNLIFLKLYLPQSFSSFFYWQALLQPETFFFPLQWILCKHLCTFVFFCREVDNARLKDRLDFLNILRYTIIFSAFFKIIWFFSWGPRIILTSIYFFTLYNTVILLGH